MGWDGSGNFTRARNWTNDEAADIGMLSANFDEEDNNLATGIGACLTKNNESKPTADFKPNATRSYALGSAAARWTNAYLSGSINVQSGTAAAATTLEFTDATLARTITFPDASGTIPLASQSNDWTGANSFVDGNLSIKGSADATKIVKFEVDGLTTGTTRTVTVPDADITIAPTASPAFTGTPTAPTAAVGTDTTQIATTAYAMAALSSGGTGKGTLKFGIVNMPQNATRYFQALGGTAVTTESYTAFYVSRPVTIKDLRGVASALAPAGQSCVITVRKNVADTSMTITLNDSVQQSSDTNSEHYIKLGRGDYITIKAVSSATLGSTIDYGISIRVCQLGTDIGAALIPINDTGIAAASASVFDISTQARWAGPGFILPECILGDNYAQTGTDTISKNATSMGAVENVYFASGDQFTNSNGGAIIAGSLSFISKQMNTGISAPGPILFGVNGQTQNTTVYLGGAFGASGTSGASATESDVLFPVSAGNIKLTGAAIDSLAAGQTATITLRKGTLGAMADTAAVLVITGAATTQTTPTASIAVSDNDLVSVKCVLSSLTGTRNVAVTMEHTA